MLKPIPVRRRSDLWLALYAILPWKSVLHKSFRNQCRQFSRKRLHLVFIPQEAEIPATSQGPSVPSTSSVYLNQESPSGRHVTVIPINNQEAPEEEDKDDSVEYENHTYGAIFDFDEKTIERGEKSKQGESEGSPRKEKDVSASQKDSPRKEKESSSPRKEKESLSPRKEKESTSRKEKDSSSSRKETSPRRGRDRNKSKSVTDPAPPLPHRPVLRRLSERRRELAEAVPHQAASQVMMVMMVMMLVMMVMMLVMMMVMMAASQGARQKVRRTSRRSSSLGPLLEGGLGDLGASTLSLESLDSNPRQAVPKSERGLGGAIPRRQGPLPAAPGEPGPPSPTHPLLGSPPRNMNELPPGIRPPPYHPLASMGHGAPPHGAPPSANSPFPPMIPLPGLTCQLSIPPGLPLPPGPPRESGAEPPRPERSLREQQVFHLRQEISHPAGVRLQLRKKDVQTSLALGDLFGCVWVLGWKQREYPVLYNAFHMGDQVQEASLSRSVWPTWKRRSNFFSGSRLILIFSDCEREWRFDPFFLRFLQTGEVEIERPSHGNHHPTDAVRSSFPPETRGGGASS